MKDLIKKISRLESGQRCAELAEFYELGVKNLDELSKTLSEGEVDDLECSVGEVIDVLIVKIKEKIKRDYLEAIDRLAALKMLNSDKKSYMANSLEPLDSEKTGTFADLMGRKMVIPTVEEILSWITTAQFAQYEKMKMEGLEPKLQISLIGKSIDGVFGIVDDTMQARNIGFPLKVVSRRKATDVLYDPEVDQHKTSDGLQRIDWIESHGGVLIEIVPTVIEVERAPDGERSFEAITKIISNNFEKYSQENFNFLSRESFGFYLLTLIAEEKFEKFMASLGDKDDLWIPLCGAYLRDTANFHRVIWHYNQMLVGAPGDDLNELVIFGNPLEEHYQKNRLVMIKTIRITQPE